MQNKIYNIASELAKKDMKFREEDKNNQTRLNILLEKIGENVETVSQNIETALAGITEKNPDIIVNSDLREFTVNLIEKQVLSGEISSISQVEVANISKSIETDIQTRIQYEKEISNTLTTSLKTGVIIFSAYMISQLREGKLSSEQLENMEKMIISSKEFKDKKVEALDSIVSEENDEEKEKILGNMERNYMENDQYIIDSIKRNPQGIRAGIIVLAKLAKTNDKTLLQNALVKAGKYGLQEAIKEDGTIDMDYLYEQMAASVKEDTKLEERFSSKEKFEEEIDEMNRRCAKKVKEELKGSKRFIEGYRKCATTDERHEYHTSYKQNKKEESKAIYMFSKNVQNGDLEAAIQQIQQLSTSEKPNMMQILSRNVIKSGNTTVIAQLQQKINDSFNANASKGNTGAYAKAVDATELDR